MDPVTATERFEHLPLTAVLPSKTNPRQHFDEAYVDELAGSIREKGVVQPILVRPLAKPANGHAFEIIAGECRFRASTRAQRETIPAVIRAYTDEQVLELQLIENIHRRDLTPLEQARGYRALIDANPTKHSAETIATRVGMSVAWVWDRLKLNDLVPEAKQLLEREIITVGHAILIARLKPSDQQRCIAVDELNGYSHQREGLWQFQGGRLAIDDAKPGKYDAVKPVSIRELEDWIRDHVRFDVAHAAKAQPLTFEETAAKVEAAAAEPGRGKKVIPITFDYRVSDDAKDAHERTYGSQSWKRADGTAKSKTCDHSVLGLVVAGDRQGESFRVCVARDKCTVHFADVVRAKQKAAKERAEGKTAKAAKTEARAQIREQDKWERERRERQAREAAWKVVKPEACRLIREHLAGVKFGAPLVRTILACGEPPADEQDIKRDFGVALSPKTAALVLALSTVELWDIEGFARSAKAWKFDVKPVTALMAEQLKPAADPKAAAAPAKAKGAKKR